MLKLYGSTTSPYVRRLRIWLANIEHEFIDWQIFEQRDREELARRNPTLKIPMIEDSGQVVFDSRVIYRYLRERVKESPLSIEEENQLTMIDAANDSMVQMLMLKRSEINTSDDKLYFNIQRERVDTVLEHLNSRVAAGDFNQWHYPAICLYCLLDWIAFRQLHELAAYIHLLAFVEKHKQHIEVTATDPRDS